MSYRVRPLDGLATGTRIENRASIFFDFNDPIDTPLVFNTLDADPPTSQAAAPESSVETAVTVTWTGADGQGAGIAGYDLFVSDNGGPYFALVRGTTAMSFPFIGERGHAYAFYTVATDNVGHVELAPGIPDATTTIINRAPQLAPVDADDIITADESTVPLTSAAPLEFAISADDLDTNQLLTFSLAVPPADDPAAAGATLYDPTNAAHVGLLQITLPSQTASPGTLPTDSSSATGILRITVGPNAAGGEASKNWCFRLVVADGAGGEEFRTVCLTVTRTNALPLIAPVNDDDTLSVAESTVALANAPAVDYDLSGSDLDTAQVLTFSLIVPATNDPVCAGTTPYDSSNPTHTESLLITVPTQTATSGATPLEGSSAAGTLRIKAGPNAAGGDTSKDWCFQIQVADDAGGNTFRTVRLTIDETNAPPHDIALDGNSIAENSVAGTLVGTLTAADLDLGDSHSFLLLDDAGGRFALVSDRIEVASGSLLDYESAKSHAIQVKAVDLAGAEFTRSIAIDVTNVNERPEAADLSVGLNEDDSIAVILAAVDPEDDPLTYLIVSPPLHGTLSGTAPNLTYTPTAEYNGPDSFTYLANDGSLDSNVATVTITVVPVNDKPTASSQSISTSENSPASGVLSGDDGDPEIVQALTFAIASGPAHGTVTLNELTGAFTYEPATGYHGPDSFTYTVADDASAGLPGSLVSDPAAVAIDVSPADATPGAEIVAGVLRVTGTPQADLVGITRLFSQIIVTATFLPGGLRLFTAASVQRIDVRLGQGNDLLIVAGNVGVPAILDGGNGDDVIYGGGGASVILGGVGNDLLLGGSGRNVIIGGTGRDTLVGGAASDLLISGTTAHDNDDRALHAILAEWTSSRTYADRIANLRGGFGPELSPTGTKLKKSETVFDDDDVDELFGGSELDWFLYDSSRDRARDKRSTEKDN